jgi:hypothetical protein
MEQSLKIEALVGEIAKQLVLWSRHHKTGSLSFEIHFKEGAIPQKNLKVISNESVLIIKPAT